MKKIFLFAAAAMVSLSSCVQTEDVYTGGLNEIGFKTAAVRGAIEGTTFGGNMAVAAAWDKNAGSYVDYFETLTTSEATGAKFTGEAGAGNAWSGDPARYWPNAGKMQFIALYPYECGKMNYAIDTTTGLTGYTVEGIDNSDLSKQNDVLFSDVLYCTAPQQSAQALQFHHALALLQVNFATTNNTEEIIVESATVHNVVLGGKLTVTAASTSSAAWDGVAATDNKFLNLPSTDLAAGAYNNATSMLVVPGEQTKMTIVYTFNGHKMTKVVDLSTYGTWQMGFKYIYNFTISANEIQFTCTVDNWKDVIVGGGLTI